MAKGLTRIIGLYQLLTGGYGCLWLAYSILLAGGGSLGALLALGLCVLTAMAGAWLWNGRPGGARLSVFAQATQVLAVSAGRISYLFTAGLAVWVRLGSGGLHFDHSFATSFHLGLASGFGSGSSPYPYGIGVNLPPLALLLYLVLGAKAFGKRR